MESHEEVDYEQQMFNSKCVVLEGFLATAAGIESRKILVGVEGEIYNVQMDDFLTGAGDCHMWTRDISAGAARYADEFSQLDLGVNEVFDLASVLGALQLVCCTKRMQKQTQSIEGMAAKLLL